MISRFFLFGLVNILMILTIQMVMFFVQSYFGIPLDGYYTSIIILYMVLGMGGAFFSLLTSRWMAKRLMRLEVLEPSTQNPTEKWLVQTTYELARKAGLPKMPEVAIYPANELNAFATGPSKSKSLVAVSSGLLEAMDKDELEGVLAHEIAHIANGDMVTMTLIQGVVNAVVMIAARLISDILASKLDERARFAARFAIYMGVSFVLALFGSILVNWFSRRREFRADYGGAKYAGKNKMIKALEKLAMGYQTVLQSKQDPAVASLKISGVAKKGIKHLFMTHPPLEERIHALKANSL